MGYCVYCGKEWASEDSYMMGGYNPCTHKRSEGCCSEINGYQDGEFEEEEKPIDYSNPSNRAIPYGKREVE